MALQEQVSSIPLQLGIDTENVPVLVDNHRFIQLQDIIFDKTLLGQLRKRYGYLPLTRNLFGGGTLTNPTSLALFNKEVEVIDAGTLRSLSPSIPAWVSRGTIPQITPTETAIAGGASNISNPDVTTIGSYNIYAFEQAGVAWLKVIDSSNGAVILYQQLQTTALLSMYTPKVLASGTTALIFASDVQSNLWVFKFNTTTLQLATPHELINSGVLFLNPTTSDSYYDVAISGAYMYVVAGTQAGNLEGWTFSASTLALRTHSDILPTAFNTCINNLNGYVFPINVVPYGGGVVLSYANYAFLPGTGGPGYINVYNYTGSTWGAGSSTSFTGTPGAAPARITSIVESVGGNSYIFVFYDQPPVAPAVLSTISVSIISPSIVSVYNGVFALSVSIASQPFVNNGQLYLLTVYTSQVQQTYFLLTQPLELSLPIASTVVAGRYFSNNNAGPPPSNGRVPAVTSTNTTAILNQTVSIGTAGATTDIAALVGLQLTFSTTTASSQLGQNLHFSSGSMLWNYDGTALSEHGFNVSPETPTLSFLTSQLGIVLDTYDSSCTTSGGSQCTGRIIIPDNGATPGGAVGNLITPGEYITFQAGGVTTGTTGYAPTPVLVYFVVNGVGAAPIGAGYSSFTTAACNISGGMTAIQVATALNTVLQTLSGIPIEYTFTYNITTQATSWTYQEISFVSNFGAGSTPPGQTPPTLNRRCVATQVYDGTNGTVDGMASIACIPASLITSNQYVTMSIPTPATAAGNFQQVYFWFSNPNVQNDFGQSNQTLVAADPNPFDIPLASSNYQTIGGWNLHYSTTFGNYLGIEIPLLGYETEGAIAAYLAAALNAISGATGLLISSATAVGSTLVVAYSVTTRILAQDYGTNPNNVGVGMGGVGQCVDDEAGPVDIEYSSVYEWVDNANELHQSAPSVAAVAYIPTYATTGGAPIQPSASIQIAVNPLALTQKSSLKGLTNVDVAHYRTLSGATSGNQIFYRITPSTALLFNNSDTTQPLYYGDFSSDIGGSGLQGINSGQTLYTTGGVVSNNAPPACSACTNAGNRLWLSGLEDPSLVQYSEEWVPGYGVAFSDLQTIRLNPIVGQTVGGPVTAISAMDGYTIFFQENQIWFTTGDGPDPTGNNGFTQPQLVANSSTMGCRDPGSVLLTPNGIIFKSSSGFYILNRSLQLQFIGADVKQYNADVVSSALALDYSNGCIFTSQSGTTLYYDYYYSAWSTFSNHQGIAAMTDGNGAYNYINVDGSIGVQTPGAYVDCNGNGYGFIATSAPLKLANIQGFQRIWRLMLQGIFFGTNPYQVQLLYDDSTSVGPLDTLTYQPGAGSSTVGVWGGSATWGASIWGEDGSTLTYPNSHQIRINPRNQLCKTIQFIFTELPPYPTNQTCALNALDIAYGIRKGTNKRVGGNQSIG